MMHISPFQSIFLSTLFITISLVFPSLWAAERVLDEKSKGRSVISAINNDTVGLKESLEREGLEREKGSKPEGKSTETLVQETVVIAERTPAGLASYSSSAKGLAAGELEHLFTHSHHFACILEPGKCLKKINKIWVETLGWTARELLETPYINFVHQDDIQKTLEYEKSFRPTGLVNRYRCKDGSYRWLDWVLLARTTLEKEVHEVACPLLLAHDITIQKILEAAFAVKASTSLKGNFMQRILESIIDIQTTHIKSISEKGDKEVLPFKAILQNLITLTESDCAFVVEVLYSQASKSFIYYNWEAGPVSTPEISQFLKQGKGQSRFAVFESLLERIVASKQPLIINDVRAYQQSTSTTIAPASFNAFLGLPLVMNEEVIAILGLINRPLGYDEELLTVMKPLFIVATYITDSIRTSRWRALAETKAKSKQLELERAEATTTAKSTFIAHMSHEIRTPLSGIMGMLSLVKKDALSADDREHIETAETSAQTLLKIINDILDISKLEAGNLTLEVQEFQPKEAAHQVVQSLSAEASRKSLTLNLVIKPEVPKVLVGDKTRITQILFNLIGNAIKFTEKGSVSVFLDGEVDTEQKEMFNLSGSVQDTGIGIKPDFLARLFKPFSQADDSIMRQFGGTGLGLFITKHLCEKMEGKITVSSEIGKGSLFNFKVRLRIPSQTEPAGEAKAITTKIPDKLPPLRILVVEDNIVNQKLIKAMLTSAGCSMVKVVSNGNEALEAIKAQTEAEKFDMVLMDGEMPVMDGFEATREIRKLPQWGTIAIVGVTAHALTTDRDKFIGAGMNGYLPKPYTKEGLIAEIYRCLPKRG